jgi:hypothetical protein
MKHYVGVEQMDIMNIAVHTFSNDFWQLPKVMFYTKVSILTCSTSDNCQKYSLVKDLILMFDMTFGNFGKFSNSLLISSFNQVVRY